MEKNAHPKINSSGHLRIYLIRHGETEWTLSGQHTGKTDIDLTENGKNQATHLGKILQRRSFSHVFSSPLKRAKNTCELAQLLKNATIDPDLKEWDYGQYEGLTTAEIWKENPHWNIFSNGAPQGESIADIRKRAQRMIDKISSFQGDVALFSHGHFLRSLAACWLRLSPEAGSHFSLYPASISILGHERTTPAVLLWNWTQCVM